MKSLTKKKKLKWGEEETYKKGGKEGRLTDRVRGGVKNIEGLKRRQGMRANECKGGVKR